MGKNKENNGHQQGAFDHAPSQQGEKTRARQQEILHSGKGAARAESGPGYDHEKARQHDNPGKHRLFEDRQQHDDADKNSEKTRLARDLDRHDHLPDDDLAERERQAMAKRKN